MSCNDTLDASRMVEPNGVKPQKGVTRLCDKGCQIKCAVKWTMKSVREIGMCAILAAYM